jgi:predicted ATPase
MARRKSASKLPPTEGFVRAVTLLRDRIENPNVFPYTLPVVRNLETLEFHPRVTFLVGENGSGKSTILEAIALLLGFNAEGGAKSFSFSTRQSESDLYRALRPIRGGRREQRGFFLRAESTFNVASYIDDIGVTQYYGGISLHEKSHGEAFLTLIDLKFRPDGLYLLDEPEAALSPGRQLRFLGYLHALASQGRSQFIMATHSPILLAYPDAHIYECTEQGLVKVQYEDTEHYRLTRDFLLHRDRFFRELFKEDPPEHNDDNT